MSKLQQRLAAGARHTCRVTSSIVIPGSLGITLAPGQRVNLDARIAGDMTLRDAVREEWFDEDAAPFTAPDVDDDEEMGDERS